MFSGFKLAFAAVLPEKSFILRSIFKNTFFVSSFSSFKNAILGNNKSENELYRKIKNYVKGFDKVLEINDGLLFRGGCGTGKTFLANCICNYLTEHGYTVLSFNLAGYLRTIKDNFQVETQLLEAAKEADMLFIDDLGSEKISDEWGKEKINRTVTDVEYSASMTVKHDYLLGLRTPAISITEMSNLEIRHRQTTY